MLKEGDKLPLFDRLNQKGEALNSQQFIGKKPLVVFFYPKNFTPGCTAEVCSFRDKYADFLENGAEVRGVSVDSVRSHDRYASSFNLPYSLLSDSDKSLQKAFKINPQFFGVLTRRVTFVFDKEGKLTLAYDSLNPISHIHKALKALKSETVV